MAYHPVVLTLRWFVLLAAIGMFAAPAIAQNDLVKELSDPTDEEAVEEPNQVEVDPVAEDDEIAARLDRILNATGWFTNAEVKVDEGVVFLSGQVDTDAHQEWATRLCRNTQAVVAVVNRIEVEPKSMWDLSGAWDELRALIASLVQSAPLLAIGLVMLIVTWLVAKWSVSGTQLLLRRRWKSQLLRSVAARAVAIPVFLLGVYLVLKVAGLTRLAVTVLGGTGIVGLVLGFAFRDIAENFLASILISFQHPFATGDLIKVAGYQGFVQSVNTRSTLLMTLEGNHVQIPNATIYKETITNFTANPNTRFDFVVGIGYDDPIAKAQSLALQVLTDHSAVIDKPEPMVLVESLGASTVNLRIYFWVDTRNFSALKVRSAIVRLTKLAFDTAGISMPDEAREVVFPAGVPVHMIAEKPAEEPSTAAEQPVEAHSAEADLSNEADEIKDQARQSRSPEEGENLLDE